MIRATIRCEAGHEQELNYGEGFDRAYVESHLTIMCGGFLKPIGVNMPGYRCEHREGSPLNMKRPPCGAKLSFEIGEVVPLAEPEKPF